MRLTDEQIAARREHNTGHLYSQVAADYLDTIAADRAKLAESNDKLEAQRKISAVAIALHEGVESERDALRAKLELSPCGVEGHREIDWVVLIEANPGIEGLSEYSHTFPAYCAACRRTDDAYRKGIREGYKSTFCDKHESTADADFDECPACRTEDAVRRAFKPIIEYCEERAIKWAELARGERKNSQGRDEHSYGYDCGASETFLVMADYLRTHAPASQPTADGKPLSDLHIDGMA